MKSTAILFISMIAMIATGCASSSSSKKGGASIKYSITFDETGKAKYDTFLRTSRDLVGNLDKGDQAVNRLVPEFKQAVTNILGLLGATKDLASKKGFVALYKDLGESLKKSKITIYIHVGPRGTAIRVKAEGAKPELVKKVEDALDSVNRLLATMEEIPKRIGNVAKASASLIVQGKNLIGSAKNDFKGLDARKLPGCTKSMQKAVAELQKAPERAATLLKSIVGVLKEIKGLKS